MDAQQITLHGITPDDLLNNIKSIVSEAISQSKKEQPQLEENLTTKEAMGLLGCSKTSLWKWEKQGKIQKYGLGRKTYFKRSELLAAIQPIDN